MLTETEIERRLPVWHALAGLFLDTELQPDEYRRIAERLKASGYDRAKLRAILEDEVAPAFVFNLLDVAGEWSGWRVDDVREIMLRSLRGARPPLLRRLNQSLFRSHIADEWSKLDALLGPS